MSISHGCVHTHKGNRKISNQPKQVKSVPYENLASSQQIHCLLILSIYDYVLCFVRSHTLIWVLILVFQNHSIDRSLEANFRGF